MISYYYLRAESDQADYEHTPADVLLERFRRELPNIVNTVLATLGLDTAIRARIGDATRNAFHNFEQRLREEQPNLLVRSTSNSSPSPIGNVTTAEQVVVEASLHAAALDTAQISRNFSASLGGDRMSSAFEDFLVWDDEMLDQCFENSESDMLYDR
jgi:hypothetical protein